MQLKRKYVDPSQAKLNVVQQDGDAGYLEGYASTFGNVDLQNEVVVKGAFAKTIKERLKKRAIKLVDMHGFGSSGSSSIIGVVEEAKEDDTGLWIRARFSSAPSAQEVRLKVREGILDSLSIGYEVVKEQFDDQAKIRYLKEIRLQEVSVVAWPANPKASIDVVKSVIPVGGFPLAPLDTAWSGTQARSRLREWVGGDPEEWGAEEWARYARGFLWVDSERADTLGAYYFPVADVIGGEPHYVFRGAAAALAAVRGARGAGDGPWAGDEAQIEAQIRRLYERFGQEFPEKGAVPEEGTPKSQQPLPASEAGRVNLLPLALGLKARCARIRCESKLATP